MSEKVKERCVATDLTWPPPPAELDPELRGSLRDIGAGMRLVHHPFVVDLYTPELNAHYNEKLQHKARLEGERTATDALNLYERPYRLSRLIEIWQDGDTDHAALSEALSWVWPDAELDDTLANPLVCDVLALLRELGFCTDRPETPRPSTDLAIWRGGMPDGVAWTTDIEVARFFARRFATDAPDPVYKATVAPEHVLARFFGRGEAEVVVDPRMLTGVEVMEGR